MYSEEEKEIVSGLVDRMCRRAIALDGTVTGEHGVGLKKRDYLREELGEDTISTMRRVSPRLAAYLLMSTYIDTDVAGEAIARSSWDPQPRQGHPTRGRPLRWRSEANRMTHSHVDSLHINMFKLFFREAERLRARHASTPLSDVKLSWQ